MPGKTAIYIPNGVEMPASVDRAAFSLPLQLAFVGRLHDGHKGVLLLPDILKDCFGRGLDAHLHIVGEGVDSDELKLRLRESQVEQTVTFHGALPNSEVRELLRKCHCLVLPSRYEGMPIVVIEAQAEGCVPICTNLPGIGQEAVEDGHNGLLVGSREAAGFVAAIESLSREGIWETMSAACTASVRAKFSAGAMGERYNEFIKAAVRGDYPLNRHRALLAFVRNRPWKNNSGW
jgi:glycosyltransferase involved in cell wall biosynthesis